MSLGEDRQTAMCEASPTLHLLLLLLLLPFLTPSPGVSGGGPTGRNAGDEALMNTSPLVTDQPYFDPSMSTTLTAHVGRRAELHCRVHSIGNRTVSWIRGRDLRILTVGRYTYTTDLRYEVLHQDGTNQWTLRIRSAQPRDQGTYECQISTKPIKAFTVFLKVLEPRGEILGSPDLYVQKASMINLTCILHNLPEPPAYVLWYHGNKDIRYSSSRGGVAVLVVKDSSTTTSHLLISSATLQDAGRYTCAPAGLSPTSVRVHVLDGEEPAAMQKNSSAALPAPLDGRPTMSNSSAVVSGATRTVKAEAVTLVMVLVPAWLQLRGC